MPIQVRKVAFAQGDEALRNCWFPPGEFRDAGDEHILALRPPWQGDAAHAPGSMKPKQHLACAWRIERRERVEEVVLTVLRRAGVGGQLEEIVERRIRSALAKCGHDLAQLIARTHGAWRALRASSRYPSAGSSTKAHSASARRNRYFVGILQPVFFRPRQDGINDAEGTRLKAPSTPLVRSSSTASARVYSSHSAGESDHLEDDAAEARPSMAASAFASSFRPRIGRSFSGSFSRRSISLFRAAA